MWRASDILEQRKEEVGRVLTQEQGKPFKEAVGEVEKVIQMLRYYAEEGKRAYGRIVPNEDPSYQTPVVRQPLASSAFAAKSPGYFRSAPKSPFL